MTDPCDFCGRVDEKHWMHCTDCTAVLCDDCQMEYGYDIYCERCVEFLEEKDDDV